MTVFWAGDPVMMQPIIDRQKDILIKAGWATNAEEVFNKLVETDVGHDENKALYHTIADLFNSWCLWCEQPIFVGDKVLSGHPYDPDA